MAPMDDQVSRPCFSLDNEDDAWAVASASLALLGLTIVPPPSIASGAGIWGIVGMASCTPLAAGL